MIDDNYDDSYQDSEVQILEGEIVELKYDLRKSRDNEKFYKEILSEIDSSIKLLFEQEKEIERFGLDEEINYRDCLVNLQKSLNEYKRVYRINF
jgi:hypothetical protein